MSSRATLPAELWLIIFNLVLGSRQPLLWQSKSLSFPEIEAYYSSHKADAPPDEAFGKLRLVCRTFYDLLGPPPHYFMGSDQVPVPATTKAIYFTDETNHLRCFRRVLTEPSVSNRTVTLDMFCTFYKETKSENSFELLCRNSGVFASLRSLTLRILPYTRQPPVLQFCTRLNDAFPSLVRLVLRLDSVYDLLTLGSESDGDVTFRNLEALSLGYNLHFYAGVRFPRLRRVALGTCSALDMAILKRSPLLDSALFRSMRRNITDDLGSLSRLKLLGVPRWGGCKLPPNLSPSLEHLWLYMSNSTDRASMWEILEITRRLPGITRITLDLSSIALACREELMADLETRDIISSGMILRDTSREDLRIVLERAPRDAHIRVATENAVQVVSKGGVLRKVWMRIHP